MCLCPIGWNETAACEQRVDFIGIFPMSPFLERFHIAAKLSSQKILKSDEFVAPVPSAAGVPLMNPIRRTLDVCLAFSTEQRLPPLCSGLTFRGPSLV